jgi:uncharacterized Zn-finger protein
VLLLGSRTEAEVEIAMLAAQDEVPPVHDVAYVDSLSVACDGDGGALGHPRVFLAIDPATGEVECPYCSRRFIYRPAGAAPPATRPEPLETQPARSAVEPAAS